MTARTDLTTAQALSAELDQVNAAIAAVNAGACITVLHVTGMNTATFCVCVDLAPGVLKSTLASRQAALQKSLTALGVV